MGEAGVLAGRTWLTVTWSFAMHDALDGSFTGVTHWGFQDTRTGMSNPAVAGYNPRCSRAELMHAFETRWVHGLNTQAPWDFVNAMISGGEPNFAPIPWFVGEYGANGQLAATIQRDLENIEQKAEEDEMFLGAAFFQFQTAHFKEVRRRILVFSVLESRRFRRAVVCRSIVSVPTSRGCQGPWVTELRRWLRLGMARWRASQACALVAVVWISGRNQRFTCDVVAHFA